jgi:hypothetical protein
VDPKRNPDPDYVRPEDWPYEEDWGSPKWEERMKKSRAKTAARRQKYGFGKCPECGAVHTNLTVTCRECGYQPEIPK